MIERIYNMFSVGLGVVLLDVPFDIMGIKLLWWSWHDTEPNIYDRHMWVRAARLRSPGHRTPADPAASY